MSHEPTILLIEDEPEISRLVRTVLTQHGYRYYDTTTGEGGLAQARARNPEVILLDLGLPDLDGLEVIRRLRDGSVIPIIVLSAREQEADKVRALDLGADDYVTKPFSANELLARIRTALRHAARPVETPGQTEFSLGELRIDLLGRRVFRNEKEIHLTPIEYKLLVTLVRYAGRVLTHRQLLKEVWGPLHTEEAHYLRVYMRQLRNKLEANPAKPKYFTTELGIGYRLKAD